MSPTEKTASHQGRRFAQDQSGRRRLPKSLGSLVVLGLFALACNASASNGIQERGDKPKQESDHVIVKVYGKTGTLVGPIAVKRVTKTDEEWRAQLDTKQYEITRRKGTEAPYCGTLTDNKKAGVYSCVCCRLPLFASGSKFTSGTGWPSFFQPIAKENVAEEKDFSHDMIRTEILCARCDAHLGHVFSDGPAPTGLRYCLNSESLIFTEKDQLTTLADPAAENPFRATAVFAGGCFWCVEAVFEELDGVIDVVSGYSGGDQKSANYEAVCTGKTGHAEAVQIIYDPARIDYRKLLEVHFATHDPTTLDRQGNDVGPQYRSSIFFMNPAQERAAKEFIEQLTSAKAFKAPIVTRLEPFKAFYPAERYHQDFVCTNPNQSYVKAIALPKVEKVRSKFAEDLKKQKPPLRQ